MSMAGLGEKLRQAREKRGLTVEQIQKQTLMHSTVITALEDGKCDDILTPTYVKSFLKKYASFLGLDAKEILNEYSVLSSNNQAAPKITIDTSKPAAQKQSEKKDPGSGNFLRYFLTAIIAVIVILIIAVIIIAGAKALYSLSKKMHQPQKIVVKTKKSVTKPDKARSKKKLAEKASLKQGKALIPQSMPLNVTIKVKAPVWVEMTKDGEKIFQRVLPRGLEESITGREKIDLYVANGDVIEIFLNGKSLGSPGHGIIKDVEITRYGMKIK